MEFKTGDRVIYTGDRYSDSPSNPMWGGTQGNIVGTIREDTCGGSNKVKWDNGMANGYMAGNLSPHIEKQPLIKEEEMTTTKFETTHKINGMLVDDMTKGEFLNAIAGAEAEIKVVQEMTTKSKAITAAVTELEAALMEIVKHFDAKFS